MSFPTVRRSHDSSYSDDSIIVSTASWSSNDSESDGVQSNDGSSGSMRKTAAKNTSGGATTANTNTATITTTTQKAPVMVMREHLLHDCPSDVRFYFASKHIADENAPLKEQAINLRHYAEISKSQQIEVIEVLNALPAVCLTSTRNAFPIFATFAKGEKKRKSRFNIASKELFQTYRHVQANVSTSDLYDKKKVTYFPQGMRQLALINLMESEHVKEFILDVSHDSYKFSSHKHPGHINLWSGKVNERKARGYKNGAKKISQWNSDFFERKELSDGLCKSLKIFSKSENRSSVSFGLKCLNQPFKTFLAPLAQTLADCKDGLSTIKSLDLGFSFLVSGYDYHNTDIGNDIALMATYAMNLANFIGSNEKLQHLNLSRNGMNSTVLLPVAKALRVNVALESLDLSKNLLSSLNGKSESLIAVLVDSLAGKPSLRHVNLTGCNLNDLSADLLCGFMKENPHVTICITANMNISRSHPLIKLDNVESEHSDDDYASS
jgi:hypothetical protein